MHYKINFNLLILALLCSCSSFNGDRKITSENMLSHYTRDSDFYITEEQDYHGKSGFIIRHNGSGNIYQLETVNQKLVTKIETQYGYNGDEYFMPRICEGEKNDFTENPKDNLIAMTENLGRAFCEGVGGMPIENTLQRSLSTSYKIRTFGNTSFSKLVPIARKCFEARISLLCDLSSRQQEANEILKEYKKNHPNSSVFTSSLEDLLGSL